MARTIMTPITVENAVTVPAVTSYGAIGDESYYDTGTWGEFVAFVTVLQTPTGTTPTLDVRIEESPDAENWSTLCDFAQYSGTPADQVTTKSLAVPGPGTSDPKTFARYIRFRAKLGNVDNVYTAHVKASPRE